MEVERKYRVNPDTFDPIMFHVAHVREMLQTYLAVSDTAEIRVRKDVDTTSKKTTYLYTEKGEGSLARPEHNQEISEAQYLALRAKGTVGNHIHKLRHTVEVEGIVAEIDVYSQQLEGLIVLEIEFNEGSLDERIDQATNFTLPELLQNIIVEDITEDDRYKNKNLIHHTSISDIIEQER